MSINKREGFRFLRFCTVGIGNTAIDLIVFFLLTLFGVAHLAAQAISYTAGVVSSYLLNRRWTFQIQYSANIPEALKFFMLNGLSLLVSTGLLFILQDLNHIGLWYSKGLATGGAVAVNYVGNRWWVFNEKQKSQVMFNET